MFSILVSVNDSSVMLKILELNQGEKIKDVCKPECIQWTKDQADIFIDKAFKGLSLTDRNRLLVASQIDAKYFVPGMIWSASKDYHVKGDIEIVLTNMEGMRKSKKEQWDKYGANLKDYQFNRTVIE